jgi:hypothetical protein
VLANDSASRGIGLPFASATVAVASVVEAPSAITEGGLRLTDTADAGPGICVRGLEPDSGGLTEVSVAVTVDVPVVAVAVTFA